MSVSITGSAVTYAGGGGGGSDSSPTRAGGAGGGGLGQGLNNDGGDGTANTGGGAGGGGENGQPGNGGSGIIVLRMPTASYSGITTGSPTVTTSGSDTIIKFTGSGLSLIHI